jgi:hypothetical protein
MIAPYGIMSVLDMLRFHATLYVALTNLLTKIDAAVDSGAGLNPDANFDGLIELSTAARHNLLRLGLPVSAKSAQRFLDLLTAYRDGKAKIAEKKAFFSGSSKPTIPSTEKIHQTAVTLNSVFFDELQSMLLFAIPAKNAPYYEATEPLFGSEVEAKLPNVAEDISEAGKCLATARYTAAIFHLMRVMEVGVQKFSSILGVTPIDHRGKDKHWQNFLDEANAAIGRLPTQDPKTKQYSAISGNLYNVKLAWRNEVMHPKQTYTEEEALEVFSASKAFMRELASVL